MWKNFSFEYILTTGELNVYEDKQFAEADSLRCSAGVSFLIGSLEACIFLRHWHRCFSVNFAKFLSIYFFTEHFRTTVSELYC